MCLSFPSFLSREVSRLYVALYDDGRPNLDWALVIVAKSDTHPIPAPPTPCTPSAVHIPGLGMYDAPAPTPRSVFGDKVKTELAGGAYGVFRIRSTEDDTSARWKTAAAPASQSSATLVSTMSDTDGRSSHFYFHGSSPSPPPQAEKPKWEFQQRRVESPDVDQGLVGLFHVANLVGTNEVGKLVTFLRNLPPGPPSSALKRAPRLVVGEDGYAMVYGDQDGQRATWRDRSMSSLASSRSGSQVQPGEKSVHREEDPNGRWSSAAWVHVALDHLRPKHPEMPSKAKVDLVVAALTPSLRAHYSGEKTFSYAVRAIDARITANDCLPYTPREYYLRARLRQISQVFKSPAPVKIKLE